MCVCVCAKVYICVYVNQCARGQRHNEDFHHHFLSAAVGVNTFSKAAPLQIEHNDSISTVTMDS